MPDPRRFLPHLPVLDRVYPEDLNRPGRGDPKICPVEKRAEGKALLAEVATAFSSSDYDRTESSIDENELSAQGTFVTIEGTDAAYPLKIDSLERWTTHRKTSPLPQWLLMSVQPATDTRPETAVVWVSDEHRHKFLKLFQDYLDKTTPKGRPSNEALVANIARIRSTILRDLWQSDGEPPERGHHWWELWLAGDVDTAEASAVFDYFSIRATDRRTVFQNRTIFWVKASWDDLQVLPFTSLPLAEIRQPGFVDTIEDLTRDEQADWVAELQDRLAPAEAPAPAVCHLDTGVARTHVLLVGSLATEDLHTVVGSTGFDADGHGTKMAGIALYGNLDHAFGSSAPVNLRHRLESVRILPTSKRDEEDLNPLDYGTVTSQAVSTAEVAATRRRVFCMPITTEPDRACDPTLWSATVDALSVGTDVVRDGNQLRLIGVPDHTATRLVVVSAGNTDLPDHVTNHDPLGICDATPVADPAQAWNALTVGAHTELDETPTDPDFAGWRTLVPAGELSPHSRTSVSFPRRWPIKPDICMEGGNVLTDGTRVDKSHPLLSVRTTGVRSRQQHHRRVSQCHQRRHRRSFQAGCARHGRVPRPLVRDDPWADRSLRRVDTPHAEPHQGPEPQQDCSLQAPASLRMGCPHRGVGAPLVAPGGDDDR